MSGTPKRLLKEGLRLHQAGRLSKAEALYRRVVKAQPADPDANNLLGLVFLQTGRHELAIKWIRAALATRPDDAQARFNLGLAYAELGQFENALQQFEKSVALDAENADAQNALANALRLTDKPDEACQIFETALDLWPDHPGIRDNFALALNELGVRRNRAGDTEAAVACFQRAVDVDARNAEAQLNLGITLEQAGQIAAAAGPLQAAIDANPRLYRAYYQLAHLRGYRVADAQIDLIREQLQDSRPGTMDRALLLYALGESLDKRDNHAEAFECFIEANALQRTTNPYDRRQTERLFADVRTVFDDAFFTRLAHAGVDDATPIFVVGMPRSGTTLVEQILASHSCVFGAGEVDCLPEALNATFGRSGSWLQNVADASAADVRRFGKRYLADLRRHAPDAARIIDKAPMNFKYIGLVAAALPAAKIVHCARDPRDTCVSIFAHPLADAHSYANDLENLGHYYALYRGLMRHWSDLLPGAIHTIRYEELVGDSENAVRRLLDYCQLDFESQCLEFYAMNRTVRTPSAGQVRQPIYSTSVGRWQHYDRHLGPLLEALERSEEMPG